MIPIVNIDVRTSCAKLDHNRHVALEFHRSASVVSYLAFGPSGIRTLKLAPEEFDENFRQRLVTPLCAAAKGMLMSSRLSDYCPEPGAYKILLEIYVMAKTEGTKNLDSLDLKGLTHMYNELASAVKLPTVKSFKDKPTARRRVEQLLGEAAEPTKKQVEAKAAKDDAAAKAFEKLANTATAKKVPAKPAKVRTPAPANNAVKPVPKARGQGIGAFCVEAILAGKSNEDVLLSVRTKFPGAATSASSVAWYRNKLKTEGQLKA